MTLWRFPMTALATSSIYIKQSIVGDVGITQGSHTMVLRLQIERKVMMRTARRYFRLLVVLVLATKAKSGIESCRPLSQTAMQLTSVYYWWPRPTHTYQRRRNASPIARERTSPATQQYNAMQDVPRCSRFHSSGKSGSFVARLFYTTPRSNVFVCCSRQGLLYAPEL